jgi:hypothetical protein
VVKDALIQSKRMAAMEKQDKNIRRRSFERVISNVPVKFFYGNSVYFGIVKNFSDNGMLISAKKIIFPLHVHLQIELLSPFNNEILVFPVRVSRLIKEDGICNGMGVELLNVTGNYLEIINSLR